MITKQRIQRDHGLSDFVRVAGDDARVPRRAAAITSPHVEAHRVIFSQDFYGRALLAYEYASTSRTQINGVGSSRSHIFTLQGSLYQRSRFTYL